MNNGIKPPVNDLGDNAVTLSLLVQRNILNEDMARFLSEAYRSRINIAVIGGNHEGKTTILKALMNESPYDQNVIIGNSREYSLNSGPARCVIIDPEINYPGNFNKTFEDAVSINPQRVIFDQNVGKERFANKGFSLINDHHIHLVAAFQPTETDMAYWERDSYPFELEVRIKRHDFHDNTTRFVIASIDQITKNFGHITSRRIFHRVDGQHVFHEDPTRPFKRKVVQGLRLAEMHPVTPEETQEFISVHQRLLNQEIFPTIEKEPTLSPEEIKAKIQFHLDAINDLMQKL